MSGNQSGKNVVSCLDVKPVTMLIVIPLEFSFDHCLSFLKRSPDELLHHLDGSRVTKALRVGNDIVVFSLESGEDGLVIGFLTEGVTERSKQYV